MSSFKALETNLPDPFASANLCLARGHSWAEGKKGGGGFLPFFIDPTQGVSLPIVYAVWLFVVISLYPFCRWFSRYKQQHGTGG